jgi:hypothetical protein
MKIDIAEKGTIGIMSALEQMRRATQPFSVVFVYGSGNRRGDIGLKNCLYGAPKLETTVLKTKKTSIETDKRAHVEHGTLPLTDVEANVDEQYITLLISHLRYFNNYRITF